MLILVNCRGWAWDHKAKNLKKNLTKYGINSDIFYMYDVIPDPRKGDFDTGRQLYKMIPFENYDVILVFSLLLKPVFNERLDLSKTFIGITSHMSYSGEASNDTDLLFLNSFQGVFVINRILQQEFYGKIHNLYYCPNGVDIELFNVQDSINLSGDLRIGWVGDPYHAAGKGYFDFIKPLDSLPGVKLFIADSESQYRPYIEMPFFYNSIDLYVCASLSEGTPNPCLEALSCGRPVITTQVGNMPELIKDGINGYIINRDFIELKKKVEFLRDNRFLLYFMSKNARATILNWSWEKQAKNYLSMIRG